MADVSSPELAGHFVKGSVPGVAATPEAIAGTPTKNSSTVSRSPAMRNSVSVVPSMGTQQSIARYLKARKG